MSSLTGGDIYCCIIIVVQQCTHPWILKEGVRIHLFIKGTLGIVGPFKAILGNNYCTCSSLKIPERSVHLAYIVHILSWTHNPNTEILSRSELFCLSQQSLSVGLFPIFVVITDLTRSLAQNMPPWKRCLLCKQHLFLPFSRLTKKATSACVSTCIRDGCHFCSFFICIFLGKKVDCSSTLAALQDAKELVKAFWKSSGRVPSALSVLDNISKKLQPQVS